MAEAVGRKLVKDRYIVLFPYHVTTNQKPKHKPAAKTTQQKKQKHNKNNPHETKNKKPHSPKNSDVMGTSELDHHMMNTSVWPHLGL